jgi:hypothetical protein
MKKLLILILLTFSVSLMAQVKPLEIEGIKTDTIPVIMLCSDTTGYTSTYVDHSKPKTPFCTPTVDVYHPRLSGHPIWIRGYVVTKDKYLSPLWTPLVGYDAMIYNPNASYITEIIQYLDHEKKPLKMMVWMSKEVDR